MNALFALQHWRDTKRKDIDMTTDVSAIVLIDASLIDPPAWNSRINFDQEELLSLSESIKLEGQRQPVEVSRNGDDRYHLHFGSRRVEACKLAGVPVKALVVDKLDPKEAVFRNATENAQRADLTTFELARTFAHLREEGAKGEDIVTRLGFTKGYVSELTKQYVKLADPIKEAWERSSAIEKERDPGKLNPRQRAEMKCCANSFLRELVSEPEARQVEMFEESVAALVAAETAVDDETEEGGKAKKKKGAKSAKETIYKVTATRYADTTSAIKRVDWAKDVGDGAKLAKLFCQYLVGDIDSIKGVIDKPEKVKAEKPAKSKK
jgi:ParB/RepB/Spo0J family partition protein